MRTVFFGTPDFAVESLNAIVESGRHEVVAVVTVPDRQAGRGQKIIQSAVKQRALELGLPLMQPERLRDEAFLSQLRQLEADSFVVVAFRMLPEVVWAMPPRGTFNLHASLLPRYRGAAPINWAIINGEQETGVSTFLLDHHIDEGNLLLQERTPIAPSDNAESLHDRLAAMGRGLVVRTLDELERGTLQARPQEGEPCAAPKLNKENCRIDFGQTGERVVNQVRGLCPYPAAYMVLRSPEGEAVNFKVYAAAAEKGEKAPVGTLKTDDKRCVKIAVTDGFVSILELQMAGKKRNSVEDFLRGNKLSDWKLDM